MGVEPTDVYLALVCFLAILVLILMLEYFVSYIQKDGKDE